MNKKQADWQTRWVLMRFVRNKWVMLTVSAVALLLFATQVLLLTHKSILWARSYVSIKASAQEVHEVLNDLSNAQLWLPWDQQGKKVMRQYSEPSSGEGARSSWNDPLSGAPQSLHIRKSAVGDGIGEIDITQHCDHNGIHWGLMFIRIVEIDGSGTKVEITTLGKRGFKAQIAANFVDQKADADRLLEKGLANLKQHMEEEAPARLQSP